jgi:hypothetical protein
MALNYGWAALIDPLVRTVEAIEPARGTPGRALHVAFESGRFYARRVIDKGLRLP